MAEKPYAPGPIKVDIKTYGIGKEHRAFVLTAPIRIGKGATKASSVQWRNGTGDEIRFWFPNGAKLFKAPEEGFENPLVIPAGEELTLYVKDEPTEGHYHYHAHCHATEDCAHGQSEPTVSYP
jgi:hypothetical protein